jgi:8-oxo-dGTP pyrophosphatase MutT (NUDIX family)
MEPTGGTHEGHDHEFHEVRWIPFDQAATMLTFETERALVARAAELLAGTTTDGPAVGGAAAAEAAS